MAGEHLVLLLIGCLALVGFVLTCWQLCTIRKLKREIDQLRSEFATPPQGEPAETVSFSASLDAVERQQLQKPTTNIPRNTAEKYRYVGSLAEQGLDAEGIARALQMPTAEVSQLLRLAKLKQATSAE